MVPGINQTMYFLWDSPRLRFFKTSNLHFEQLISWKYFMNHYLLFHSVSSNINFKNCHLQREKKTQIISPAQSSWGRELDSPRSKGPQSCPTSRPEWETSKGDSCRQGVGYKEILWEVHLRPGRTRPASSARNQGQRYRSRCSALELFPLLMFSTELKPDCFPCPPTRARTHLHMDIDIAQHQKSSPGMTSTSQTIGHKPRSLNQVLLTRKLRIFEWNHSFQITIFFSLFGLTFLFYFSFYILHWFIGVWRILLCLLPFLFFLLFLFWFDFFETGSHYIV